MKIIRAILFTLNILIWVVLTVLLFVACDFMYGLAGLAVIIAYFLGYSVSGGMTISRRDLYRLPDVEVFKKKIRYGNGWACTVTAIIALLTHMEF